MFVSLQPRMAFRSRILREDRRQGAIALRPSATSPRRSAAMLTGCGRADCRSGNSDRMTSAPTGTRRMTNTLLRLMTGIVPNAAGDETPRPGRLPGPIPWAFCPSSARELSEVAEVPVASIGPIDRPRTSFSLRRSCRVRRTLMMTTVSVRPICSHCWQVGGRAKTASPTSTVTAPSAHPTSSPSSPTGGRVRSTADAAPPPSKPRLYLTKGG